MRKTSVIFMLLIVVFMAVSCTNTQITNLEGTWATELELISEQHGWIESSYPEGFSFTEQKGHIFKGYKIYTNRLDKKEYKEMFSGSISQSGHIVIAEHEDGILIGHLEDNNTITLQYAENGELPKAVYYTLKRNK